MAAEDLLIFFVGVTALAMVLQAVVFWKTFQSVKRLVLRLESAAEDLGHEARDIIAHLKEVAASFEHVRLVSENLGRRFDEVMRMVDGRVHDVNSLLETIAQVGSKQAEKVDEVVTDTVVKFEQVTEVIQRDIVRPVVEIASLLKGVRSGLEYLFSREPLRSDDNYPDDELFV